MSKIGRNDICPCGSGKKYKKCCQGKTGGPRPAPSPTYKKEQWLATLDPVDRDSNRTLFLINDGKLDQAEKAAKQLIKNYPDVNDGFDRLAMVYEARGQNSLAADVYQKALDFTLENEGFDESESDYYRDKIKKLRTAPNS